MENKENISRRDALKRMSKAAMAMAVVSLFPSLNALANEEYSNYNDYKNYDNYNNYGNYFDYKNYQDYKNYDDYKNYQNYQNCY